MDLEPIMNHQSVSLYDQKTGRQSPPELKQSQMNSKFKEITAMSIAAVSESRSTKSNYNQSANYYVVAAKSQALH